MSKTFKYLFLVILLFLIAISIFLFIKESKETKNTNTKIQNNKKIEIEKTLNLGIAEYDTINPLVSTNKNVQEISKLIFEPLFYLTNDYKLQTCIADECSKIDINVYLVSIKKGLKWQDGKSITTRDIAFSINNLKKTDNSIYNVNVVDIKTVEIVDDYLIKIITEGEKDFFEYNLIFPIFPSQYDFENNIIGSGKFKIVSIDNNKIKLEKNQYYKDYDKIIIENINIYLYNNLGEIYNAFKLGNIDIINTENINYQEYIGTIGYNTKKYDGRKFSFIALNIEKEELSFKEVRQAINLALNKNEIIKSIYNKAETNEVPFQKEHWLNYEIFSENNKEKAIEGLLQNEWEFVNNIWNKKIENKVLKLEFYIVINETNQKMNNVAELIKKQLSEIGIIINIIEINQSLYQNELNKKKYDMILIELQVGITPNLNSFIGINNFSNYKNDKLLYLQNELKIISDEQIIKQRYDDIYTIQKENVPFIGLGFNTNAFIYNSKLMGTFFPNNFDIFYNIEMWYKEK